LAQTNILQEGAGNLPWKKKENIIAKIQQWDTQNVGQNVTIGNE